MTTFNRKNSRCQVFFIYNALFICASTTLIRKVSQKHVLLDSLSCFFDVKDLIIIAFLGAEIFWISHEFIVTKICPIWQVSAPIRAREDQSDISKVLELRDILSFWRGIPISQFFFKHILYLPRIIEVL